MTGVVVVVLVVFVYLYPYSTYTPQEKTLSELQIVACRAAQEGGTCFTKLPELELVSPETCCKALGDCCQE